MSPTRPPLLELRGIRKIYGGGDAAVTEVLRGVDLTIHAGEYVAIVGASGSGKSTLMNVLGLLDRPTEGQYLFAGRDVAALDADEQAWLRRERFGFVFQQYHLVRTESALANVEMPAIYAGMNASERRQRAASLLERLSLGDRLNNRPAQLSGGQQQRVSIARALMNGGEIIFADEPTGALDSRSGQEVLALLDELSAAGHTIVLITHDRAVAARASRVIEIADGRILSDTGSSIAHDTSAPVTPPHASARSAGASWASLALWRSCWHSLASNRFRTALTLLGIVIGVAAVIVLLAIGEGGKRRVVAQMSAFGANLLIVSSQRPSPRAAPGVITREDVEALARLPEVRHVMPQIHGQVIVRHGNTDYDTSARGVGLSMPHVQHWPMQLGVFFDEQDERTLAPVVVLGQVVKRALFPDENPVGRYVLINSMPYRVIGVLAEKGATSGEADDDDMIAMPFTTASARVFGRRNPGFAIVAADDSEAVGRVERSVRALMMERHRVEDFRIRNRAAMIAAEMRTQDTMSLLQALTAAISLVVGGIGVMNVMLMTVRERTREIGIRIATGARQRDILQQFLSEAALISLLGGLLGAAVAVLVGMALTWFDIAILFSVRAVIAVVLCALATGLLFGFMPAKRAARLDPVVALAGE